MAVFDRSGIAALSDLQTPEWRTIFENLEKQQSTFLQTEHRFLSSSYAWPRDPLHTWSRIWEYPYVAYHLAKWREAWGGSEAPHVADVGSGVTFFPFAIASLGCRVTCTDVDPVCGPDLQRAAAIVPHAPGSVEFRLASAVDLPFNDKEVDAVYCISVLEHIPDFDRTVCEIARIVRPNGLVLLTVDLDLAGTAAISVPRFNDLLACVNTYFEYLLPGRCIHVADQLTSSSGPYALQRFGAAEMLWFRMKQLVKPLFGRAACGVTHLAVEGMVLRRRTLPHASS